MTVPDLTVIIISYNTRELTLACLESVYAETRTCSFEVIAVDNASADGSAEAIAERFPGVHLIRSPRNLGFAAANNLAAESAGGRYLLLLNSDTVVLDAAIDRLVAFAEANPEHGIYGGRTLFEDGSLNPASCWADITPWSMFCTGMGLSAMFRGSRWLNPESYGRWPRDTVREVDIVTGCLLLIERERWVALEGFDLSFFMYGDDADLCRRARSAGARPVICPEACIIHYGGRSEALRADKLVKLTASRNKLVRRHFPRRWVRFGLAMHRLWVLERLMAWSVLARVGRGGAREKAAVFSEVWRRRAEWSGGTSATGERTGASAREPVG